MKLGREEGMSGEGSCPADRQAATWWSHLATRSRPGLMGHLRISDVAKRPLGASRATGPRGGEQSRPLRSWKQHSGVQRCRLSLCVPRSRSQFADSTAAALPLSFSSPRVEPFTPHSLLRRWRGTSRPDGGGGGEKWE